MPGKEFLQFKRLIWMYCINNYFFCLAHPFYVVHTFSPLYMLGVEL